MNKMGLKLYGFFAVCLAVASATVEIPPELQDYIDEIHGQCVKASGITEEEHANYDIKTQKDDHKMSCYMKCLMLESQWMLPDGTIRFDFIKKEFELFDVNHPEIRDVLVSAVNKCHDISDGADLCEKAYNFNWCLYEADNENWFLV